MDVDALFERVKSVDLYGILQVEKADLRENGDLGVWITFWRLTGAFRNDKDACISMALDPNGPGGDLYFFVPPLEECKPGDKAMTYYMDANMRAIHGAHRWQAGNTGEVVFSYSLPVAGGGATFLMSRSCSVC